MARLSILLVVLSLTACLPVQHDDQTITYRGADYTFEEWVRPAQGTYFWRITLRGQRYDCEYGVEPGDPESCYSLIDRFLDEAGFGNPQQGGEDSDTGISDYDGAGGGF